MKKVVNYKAQKEKWEKAKEEAFKKLNLNTTIDGFRKGKAPRKVFEKNYPGKINIEAANKLIDDEYFRIIKEDGIEPILDPSIDIIKMSDDELEVNFTLITTPIVKLGEYKNLGIKPVKVKVTQDEVNSRIDNLLKSYAELIIKESDIVENKDIAVIDFEGFLNGEAFDGGKGENYSLEIGSHTFIEGFEEGIIGMKKGEEKDLNLKFPEDYASEELKGQDVVFKVKVNEIKVKELPELDEEFFKDLGMDNITTKEELEKKIKAEIKEEKEQSAEAEYIDKLLEKATSNMTIELDEEIIDAEASDMYSDMIHRMSHQGINEEMYLSYAQTTKEDIIEHLKKEAEIRLKNSYLLNEIIKVEKIEVTDEETEEELEKLAVKYNCTKEEIISSYGNKERFTYDLKFRRAIEVMKSN